MKKSLFTILLVSCLVGCSKNKTDVVLPNSDTAPIVSKGNTLNLFDDDPDGKKYAARICYNPSNPNNVGTECEIPGSSCKQYSCNISSGATGNKILSENEINQFALIDAQLLLERGLIEKKDLEYFRKLSVAGLKERNNNLK